MSKIYVMNRGEDHVRLWDVNKDNSDYTSWDSVWNVETLELVDLKMNGEDMIEFVKYGKPTLHYTIISLAAKERHLKKLKAYKWMNNIA